MTTKVVKVSKKGQITLPREARKTLGTELVKVVTDKDGVRIEPVKDLAGSLKRYASEYIPVEKAREKAWTEVVSEKHGIRD
jgi:AbrB family looped-hinge helix DNA binding protein